MAGDAANGCREVHATSSPLSAHIEAPAKLYLFPIGIGGSVTSGLGCECLLQAP